MRTPKEDEALFLDFATSFLGYGSLNAPIWLVGPEAGGGASIVEVHNRIIAWDARGRKGTEDLQEYHRALKLPPKCDWAKNKQKTWAALIRIIFAIGGMEPGRNDVLRFQVEAFGKAEGHYCVADVSQISCPSEKDWKLGPTGIGWLETKKAYKARIVERRCALFKALLNSCKAPSLVIFCGGNEDLWHRIAGAEKTWERLPLPGSCQVQWSRKQAEILWRRNENTLFIIMPHPNGIRPSGQGSVPSVLRRAGAGYSGQIRTVQAEGCDGDTSVASSYSPS
jgi:hypothetical protein